MLRNTGEANFIDGVIRVKTRGEANFIDGVIRVKTEKPAGGLSRRIEAFRIKNQCY